MTIQKMTILGMICSLLIISSCNRIKDVTSENDQKNSFKRLKEMKITGEKKYALDSLTAQDTESVYLFESPAENRSYLTLLNARARRIYFFDDSTGQTAFFIQLSKDGPNGVGSLSGHYVHTLDSIFLFDEWTSKVTIVNRQGVKISAFTITPETNTKLLYPGIKLSTVNPMVFEDNKMIFSGSRMGEYDNEDSLNRPVIIIYDIATRRLKYDVSYPDVYQGANWGSINFRDIFTAINDDTHSIVISFPADHYIYLYDIRSGTKQKIYAGSENFGGISSLHKEKTFQDKEYLYRYYGMEPSYSSMIYDRFRKVYYRIAELPIKDYNQDEREKSVKQFSIVLLDSNFVKIGETMVPHLSHSRLTFFVSKEGLNMKKYTEDEDNFTFSTFTPVDIVNH